MHKLKFLALLPILLLSFVPVKAQETYWSVEFADAIIDRYANINDLTGKGWEYSNSIVLIGIEKLYYETGDTRYLAYIKKYIDKYVDSQGNISFDASANNLDHLHPGWLCITLYEELGLEKYKLAADNIRAEFDNQPRNASGGFWHKERYPNQMWADGIYMAEPFLIRYGTVFNELEYAANEAAGQAILLADHAYDSTKNLLMHGWDETREADWADTITGLSPEIWSRGMGWYCMALVDILEYLPESHDYYPRMLEIVQGLAQGVKDYQDPVSGLWYQVVDKADSAGNWHETSGSSLFVYFLKRSIDEGYIDSASYYPTVEKGWEGLQTKITLDAESQPVINDFVRGMGIQVDYAGYISQEMVSTPESAYPHGYCGILMAASAMEFPLPEPPRYTLTVDVSGGGEVTISPEQEEYVEGAEVTLTAELIDGLQFTGWTGSFTSSDNPLTIIMDSNMVFTARYEPVNLNLEAIETENILLFPVPATDFLWIELTTDQYPERISIVNATGMVVEEIVGDELKIDSSEILRISLSNLRPGMYYLVLYTGQASRRMSFVKR